VRNQYVFGVFDGHGRVGHKASNFVASAVRRAPCVQRRRCALRRCVSLCGRCVLPRWEILSPPSSSRVPTCLVLSRTTLCKCDGHVVLASALAGFVLAVVGYLRFCEAPFD
jgi:hypothetical protein